MYSTIRLALLFPLEIYAMGITYLPGTIGFYLRSWYWRKKLKYLGKCTKIDVGVYFQNPKYISIGNNCWIDRSVIILAGIDKSTREKIVIKTGNDQCENGVVKIGNNVHIGPMCILSGISAGITISDNCCITAKCCLYAFTHHYKSKKQKSNKSFGFGSMVALDKQCLIEGPIFIGFNTGIAMNVIILPGSVIMENSFVSINSVVKHGIYPENSFISGNPAKTIRPRYDTDE